MKITRAPRKGNFTIIPNATLRDRELSFRSRGLLAYLLTHDDGWSTSVERMRHEGKEGRDAISTALNELIEARYLVRRCRRAANGRFHWEHFVFDEAQPEDSVDQEIVLPDPDAAANPREDTKPQVKPPTGNPHAVFPSPEDPLMGDQRRVDRQRSDSDVLEGSSRKTNKKSPPPPTPSSAPQADPSSATPEEEAIRALIASLPEVLRPRSARQSEALIGTFMPLVSGGWDLKTLADHAALLPLPEMVLNPPGFIKQRLAHLPPTPQQSRSKTVPWCGQCHQQTRFVEPDEGAPYRCPACHPSYLDEDSA